MILSRVVYELFDHEVEWLAAHPNPEAVELRRQVRLELDGNAKVFVAWTWFPSGDDFYVAFSPTSFCIGDSDGFVDASDWPLWSGLIGREIVLAYRDESTKQVLEVRSENATVLCCSFGRGVWHIDCLCVSGQMPK
jgi:hypothetical protein